MVNCDVGCTAHQTASIQVKPAIHPIYITHYGLKLQADAKICDPINGPLKDGVLALCHSAWNTPLNPVLKPKWTYCMVHDLQAINNIIIFPQTPSTKPICHSLEFEPRTTRFSQPLIWPMLTSPYHFTLTSLATLDFHLDTVEKERVVNTILYHTIHGERRMLKYHSAKLDPVSQGHTGCIKHLLAIQITLKKSKNLVQCHQLIVHTSHGIVAVRVIIQH